MNKVGLRKRQLTVAAIVAFVGAALLVTVALASVAVSATCTYNQQTLSAWINMTVLNTRPDDAHAVGGFWFRDQEIWHFDIPADFITHHEQVDTGLSSIAEGEVVHYDYRVGKNHRFGDIELPACGPATTPTSTPWIQFSPTVTWTPIPPTATPTLTQVPPTSTPTQTAVPPTPTSTFTMPAPSGTPTWTASPTPGIILSPTFTPTGTATATATETQPPETQVPPGNATPTATETQPPVASLTPSASGTPGPSPTPSASSTPTPTATTGPSATPTVPPLTATPRAPQIICKYAVAEALGGFDRITVAGTPDKLVTLFRFLTDGSQVKVLPEEIVRVENRDDGKIRTNGRGLLVVLVVHTKETMGYHAFVGGRSSNACKTDIGLPSPGGQQNIVDTEDQVIGWLEINGQHADIVRTDSLINPFGWELAVSWENIFEVHYNDSNNIPRIGKELPNLKPGDTITIYLIGVGFKQYVVTESKPVMKSAQSYGEILSNEAPLVIFTCWGKWVKGSFNQYWIVYLDPKN